MADQQPGAGRWNVLTLPTNGFALCKKAAVDLRALSRVAVLTTGAPAVRSGFSNVSLASGPVSLKVRLKEIALYVGRFAALRPAVHRAG
jgi:hypothetical protein